MIQEMFRVEGKVALVTGAGRGIGRASALALAESGADVVVVSRTLAQVEEVAAQVVAMGRRAVAVSADVVELERLGELTATVYSYRTPIAACIGGNWYRLPGRYSVTTSRHQNRIGECMDNLDTLEELADLAEIYGVDLSEVSR